MSGKRVWNMKELSQKLERLIETAVEKEEIAGANIVVIRDGQEMAFAADGYADTVSYTHLTLPTKLEV